MLLRHVGYHTFDVWLTSVIWGTNPREHLLQIILFITQDIKRFCGVANAIDLVRNGLQLIYVDVSNAPGTAHLIVDGRGVYLL